MELRAWLVQRMSAVYMLFFSIFLFTHFVLDPPKSYPAWRDWMLSPGISIVCHDWVCWLPGSDEANR